MIDEGENLPRGDGGGGVCSFGDAPVLRETDDPDVRHRRLQRLEGAKRAWVGAAVIA
ncbi:hypothetical protein D3C80_1911490 [compost metagenome]